VSNVLLVIAVSANKVLLGLLKNPLVWVTACTTVAIPVLTAATTRPSTPGKIKAFVSFLLAGIYALVAWLGALNGDVDWKMALVVFAVAAAGAGGINAAWISGPLATWLGLKTPINIGPKPLTPEKAAEIHSHGEGSVVQPPLESLGQVSSNPIDPATWTPPPADV
jgi:predicted small integral membrane protein